VRAPEAELDLRAAHETLRRATEHLLGLQTPEGWWKGELETNVTMDAEDLLLREFLGVRTDRQTQQSANWIRRNQRADGTWAVFHDGPPDLSTTAEAYVALRLAGDDSAAAHMRRAAAFVRDAGGVERARMFTHMWLALFGLWPWERVPVIPAELILLPPWCPFNIYDVACWARQTFVALMVVSHYRPVRPAPVAIDELRTGLGPGPDEPLATWAGAFRRAERLVARYHRRPLPGVRRLALTRAEHWIVRRQEWDGSWGGIQPPWVYSLIALRLRGYPLSHPIMRTGLDGLDRFTIVEGDERRLEACQSPVWDTALSMVALRDAGLPADHEALARAADWLLDNEVRHRGDWAVRRPALPPGGWAFEFANVNYPDTDDTAEVVLALDRVAHPAPERVHGAVSRAVGWMLGMRSSDHGWAAFDAENTRRIMRELPFCDFGEIIDPPSADVTAHVVEALAGQDGAAAQAVRDGVGWLLANQEPDGSWFGRWGGNYIYGTGAVVPALVAAGVDHAHPAVRRAVRWLEDQQRNADGGWGEDLRSYEDSSWVGRGHSTASQTAWALLALHAAGETLEGSRAVRRGVAWLAATQRVDGTWDEDHFTGTGFPGDFYINYHLYRLTFPVSALARVLSEAEARR
jgi:squalene-hopene/tetraprenyl-beta-curcumene cyclase